MSTINYFEAIVIGALQGVSAPEDES